MSLYQGFMVGMTTFNAIQSASINAQTRRMLSIAEQQQAEAKQQKELRDAAFEIRKSIDGSSELLKENPVGVYYQTVKVKKFIEQGGINDQSFSSIGDKEYFYNLKRDLAALETESGRLIGAEKKEMTERYVQLEIQEQALKGYRAWKECDDIISKFFPLFMFQMSWPKLLLVIIVFLMVLFPLFGIIGGSIGAFLVQAIFLAIVLIAIVGPIVRPGLVSKMNGIVESSGGYVTSRVNRATIRSVLKASEDQLRATGISNSQREDSARVLVQLQDEQAIIQQALRA